MMRSITEFSTESLLSKILYIQNSIDADFRMILDLSWRAENSDYRNKIRQCMEEKFTSKFSRQQLALLNDLNWRPEADEGFFSISHCHSLGGFTYSQHQHGFDVEDIRRISTAILQRTAPAEEIQNSLKPEFLWVAKEAGFKAHSFAATKPYVVTDFITSNWQSHYENQVFSFRLNSEKTLDFSLNKGFIFLEGDKLFCSYFK